MWADMDHAMAFPDLGASSADALDLFNDGGLKHGMGGAAGPAARDLSQAHDDVDVDVLSSSIDAMLDGFLSAFQLSEHQAHSADDCHECLVCYEKKEARGSVDHGNFARCGHGKHLCTPCSERLHRCPLCRDIKDGFAEYVLATEALQGGRPCDEQWDAGRTSLYLPEGADDGDEDSPSCSAAPAPSPRASPNVEDPTTTPADLDNVDTDPFFGVVDDFDGLSSPPLAGPAPPSWAVLRPAEPVVEDADAVMSIEDGGTDEYVYNEVVQHEQEQEQPAAPPQQEPELTASGRPLRRAAQSPAWRQRISEPEPETSSLPLARVRAPPSPSPQPSEEDDEPLRRTNHVSREADNPFAVFNVPDYDVEQLSFGEFQQLMKSKKFTSSQVAAGKRFRKRLKNRRQVMLYARKQQVGARSLQQQNQQLTRKVDELARENTELRDKNLFLNQTLEYLEQARTDAVNECQSLQQQMHMLTSTMNDLGYFDEQDMRTP